MLKNYVNTKGIEVTFAKRGQQLQVNEKQIVTKICALYSSWSNREVVTHVLKVWIVK